MGRAGKGLLWAFITATVVMVLGEVAGMKALYSGHTEARFALTVGGLALPLWYTILYAPREAFVFTEGRQAVDSVLAFIPLIAATIITGFVVLGTVLL